MYLTSEAWPTLHHSASLDLTTTAYHFDFTSDSGLGSTGDNLWFLNDVSTTTDVRPLSSVLFGQRELLINKTRGPFRSGGNRNLTAYRKRVGKVTAEQRHTCSVFRRILNTYVLGLMCLFGILGNIVSILVLQKDKNNKVAIFLLQSLAAADVILLIMSFLILSVYHGFMVDNAALGAYHRSMMPYIVAHINPIGVVAQAMVIWCTVLLAINRYIAICKPFAAKKWLTMKWARAQVSVLLVFDLYPGVSFGLTMDRF